MVRSDCNAAWSVAHWSPCSDGLRTREVIPIPDSDTNNCDNHDNDKNDSSDNGNNDNGVTGVLPMGNWAGGTSFKLWSLEIQVIASNLLVGTQVPPFMSNHDHMNISNNAHIKINDMQAGC